ncbi:MAG: TspO/MBR family protein [Chlamydiales bacterium]|nr:TspO/MBR family protein [Chlamydiales bacterium]
MPKWTSLALCLIVCVGGGWVTGLVTEDSVTTWYPTLVKPSWTPPNYLFPIAWTILYTLMAIALWKVIIAPTRNKQTAYSLFGLQLVLNFIWSFLFFYLESPGLGLIDIILMWIAIVATMAAFWRHSQVATYLLLPYLAWVSYAFSLNLFIWMHN